MFFYFIFAIAVVSFGHAADNGNEWKLMDGSIDGNETINGNESINAFGSEKELFDGASNGTLQLGDMTFPIVLDVNVKGQQNESRIIKINCRSARQEMLNFHGSLEPTPFLERSICEFSVKEAMVIVGFSFILLLLILAALFLCCAAGRDDTIPVAVINDDSKRTGPSFGRTLAAQNHGHVYGRTCNPVQNSGAQGTFSGDQF